MDDWISVEAFAAQFMVSVQTVYNWHATGKAPRAHKIGRRLFFRPRDVEQWAETRAEPDRMAVRP